MLIRSVLSAVVDLAHCTDGVVDEIRDESLQENGISVDQGDVPGQARLDSDGVIVHLGAQPLERAG